MLEKRVQGWDMGREACVCVYVRMCVCVHVSVCMCRCVCMECMYVSKYAVSMPCMYEEWLQHGGRAIVPPPAAL